MSRSIRVPSLLFGAVLFAGLGLAAPSAHAADAPVANKDHWHTAFGLWICGSWLPALEAPDDPIGIHTHGDGLIHVHPFDARAEGRNAVLQKFFDDVRLELTASGVTVAGRAVAVPKTCNGEKTVLRTFVWGSVKAKRPNEIKTESGRIALKDGQVIALVFGGARVNPGLPPAAANLTDPGDLPLPELGAAEMKALPALPARPAFDLMGSPPASLETLDITVGSGTELRNGSRGYLRFVAYLWRTKERIADDWSATNQPYALARVGKGRNLPGLDHGMLGMKVGGLRRIVMPPREGFGASGSGPVKATDTIVFYVQLVAVQTDKPT